MENEFHIGQQVSVTWEDSVFQGRVIELCKTIIYGIGPANMAKVLDTTEKVTILPQDPMEKLVGTVGMDLSVRVELPGGRSEDWMFRSKTGHFKNVKPVIEIKASNEQRPEP
jgi:hypothetical protein